MIPRKFLEPEHAQEGIEGAIPVKIGSSPMVSETLSKIIIDKKTTTFVILRNVK
jgi:hypothetical protein